MTLLREREVWTVEHTLIDEGVPVARDAWRLVNQYGEVMDDSTSEDYEAVELEAECWNRGDYD